ncbi:MAG: hypothetical protein U1E68_03530 [Sphingomonadaceae bacterium]|jgi:hypothetical protein
MMTVLAILFPLALVMALGTIALMLKTHGGKMMAALRMEPYSPRTASPHPPVGERASEIRLGSVRSGSHPAVRQKALLAA